MSQSDSFSVAALSTTDHAEFTRDPLPRQSRNIAKPIFRRFLSQPWRRGRATTPRSELYGIMRLLFGPAAWKVLQPTLGVSLPRAKELMRADGGDPTSEQLRRLARWSARLPGMLEDWRVAQHAAIEAEADRRRQEIAAGVTQLALLRLERRKKDEAKRREAAARKAVRKARDAASRPRVPRRGLLIRQDARRPDEHSGEE